MYYRKQGLPVLSPTPALAFCIKYTFLKSTEFLFLALSLQLQSSPALSMHTPHSPLLQELSPFQCQALRSLSLASDPC